MKCEIMFSGKNKKNNISMCCLLTNLPEDTPLKATLNDSCITARNPQCLKLNFIRIP